ncbi:MAG: Unknown protein [uncultured Thiotrichaceae bacterium]|uniref:DOMON-like domain-containing protein n=1 Tax=uncultured Thiotrichaceae bacterium TaxID=298394 RepID=A0A6S6UF36_9GAMM|nr:MAG: Unknown protein [uncultured Thiotrichaceae bacterium]
MRKKAPLKHTHRKSSRMNETNKHVLQSGQIKLDWFGASCPENHFVLSDSGTDFCFETEVKIAPPSTFPAKPGEYFEGLWEYDVAELFIAADNSDYYIEINLAPNSAWWMMAFSAPRQRFTNFRIDHHDIKTEYLLGIKHWKSSLCIPHGLLQNILQTDTMRFNVSYILGTPKQYLSYCNLLNAEPNFHIPTQFKNLNRY